MTELFPGEAPQPHGWASRETVPHAGSRSFYRDSGKRCFDIAIILPALPLLLPVIVLLAVLVALDGGKPFFGHLRVGRDGQLFKCWKLRSMVTDAEEKLRLHLAGNARARAEWEASFKLEHDPRVTRLGQFLRRSSLDELPQIWNILRGQMSLVGPRPVTSKEIAMYRTCLRHYYALRPGLTGLWQISGRNDISYTERVALDVAYARNHGFIMDLRIIFATFLAVLNRTGR